MSRFTASFVALSLVLALTACAKPPKPEAVVPAPSPAVSETVPPVREPVREEHPLALEIEDFRTLRQDPGAYAGSLDPTRPLISEACSLAAAREFERRFFAPWDDGRPVMTAKDAAWGFKAYGKRKVFGENLREREAGWVQGLETLAGLESFPNLGSGRPALAVRHSSLRLMPTERPMFLDPALPGEGYPFDQLQQSGVWAGTPLNLLHLSRDGAWAWAESPFASGWIPVQDVAYADHSVMAKYRTGRYLSPVVDNLAIADLSGGFLLNGRVGTVLPVVEARGRRARILVPVADVHRQVVLVEAEASREEAAVLPLPATPENLARVASRMVGQAYGWGGLYQDRDCSALVRDLYAPFGLWMPRNSSAQARNGVVTPFRGWSGSEKESWLTQRGVPFLTLVWLKGHIMVYVGEHEGRPVVFHSLWGLRTINGNGAEGRKVIGESVVTTLTPGGELPNVKNTLLERVEGATIVSVGDCE